MEGRVFQAYFIGNNLFNLIQKAVFIMPLLDAQFIALSQCSVSSSTLCCPSSEKLYDLSLFKAVPSLFPFCWFFFSSQYLSQKWCMWCYNIASTQQRIDKQQSAAVQVH